MKNLGLSWERGVGALFAVCALLYASEGEWFFAVGYQIAALMLYSAHDPSTDGM